MFWTSGKFKPRWNFILFGSEISDFLTSHRNLNVGWCKHHHQSWNEMFHSWNVMMRFVSLLNRLEFPLGRHQSDWWCNNQRKQDREVLVKLNYGDHAFILVYRVTILHVEYGYTSHKSWENPAKIWNVDLSETVRRVKYDGRWKWNKISPSEERMKCELEAI